MKLFIILIMFLNVSYSQEIVGLKKGDVAPFDGALVDQGQMKKFREHKTQLDLEITQNDALKTLNDRLENKLTIKDREIKEMEWELTRTRVKGNIYNVGFFVLGVVITGFAAKAAIESTR